VNVVSLCTEHTNGFANAHVPVCMNCLLLLLLLLMMMMMMIP